MVGKTSNVDDQKLPVGETGPIDKVIKVIQYAGAAVPFEKRNNNFCLNKSETNKKSKICRKRTIINRKRASLKSTVLNNHQHVYNNNYGAGAASDNSDLDDSNDMVEGIIERRPKLNEDLPIDYQIVLQDHSYGARLPSSPSEFTMNGLRDSSLSPLRQSQASALKMDNIKSISHATITPNNIVRRTNSVIRSTNDLVESAKTSVICENRAIIQTTSSAQCAPVSVIRMVSKPNGTPKPMDSSNNKQKNSCATKQTDSCNTKLTNSCATKQINSSTTRQTNSSATKPNNSCTSKQNISCASTSNPTVNSTPKNTSSSSALGSATTPTLITKKTTSETTANKINNRIICPKSSANSEVSNKSPLYALISESPKKSECLAATKTHNWDSNKNAVSGIRDFDADNKTYNVISEIIQSCVMTNSLCSNNAMQSTSDPPTSNSPTPTSRVNDKKSPPTVAPQPQKVVNKSQRPAAVKASGKSRRNAKSSKSKSPLPIIKSALPLPASPKAKPSPPLPVSPKVKLSPAPTSPKIKPTPTTPAASPKVKPSPPIPPSPKVNAVQATPAEESDLSEDEEVSCSKDEETDTAPEDEDEENAVTRCICNYLHDDGFMIACDTCGVWQHVECVGLTKKTIPEIYRCEQCEPRKLDAKKAAAMQAFKLSQRQNMNSVQSSPEPKDTTRNRKASKSRKGSKPKRTPQRNSLPKAKSDSPMSDIEIAKSTVKLLMPKKNEGVGKSISNGSKERRARSTCKSSMGISSDGAHSSDNSEALISLVDQYEECHESIYSQELEEQLGRVVLPTDLRYTKSLQYVHRCRATLLTSGAKMLVTSQSIPANQPIIELLGKIHWTGSQTFQKENITLSTDFVFYYKLGANQEVMEVCVDMRDVGNDARFVRKSCTPNSVLRHSIEDNKVHIYLCSVEPLEKHQEILINHYSAHTANSCACNSEDCRAKKRLSMSINTGENAAPKTLLPVQNLAKKVEAKSLPQNVSTPPVGLANGKILTAVEKEPKSRCLTVTKSAGDKKNVTKSDGVKNTPKNNKTAVVSKSVKLQSGNKQLSKSLPSSRERPVKSSNARTGGKLDTSSLFRKSLEARKRNGLPEGQKSAKKVIPNRRSKDLKVNRKFSATSDSDSSVASAKDKSLFSKVERKNSNTKVERNNSNAKVERKNSIAKVVPIAYSTPTSSMKPSVSARLPRKIEKRDSSPVLVPSALMNDVPTASASTPSKMSREDRKLAAILKEIERMENRVSTGSSASRSFSKRLSSGGTPKPEEKSDASKDDGKDDVDKENSTKEEAVPNLNNIHDVKIESTDAESSGNESLNKYEKSRCKSKIKSEERATVSKPAKGRVLKRSSPDSNVATNNKRSKKKKVVEKPAVKTNIPRTPRKSPKSTAIVAQNTEKTRTSARKKSPRTKVDIKSPQPVKRNPRATTVRNKDLSNYNTPLKNGRQSNGSSTPPTPMSEACCIVAAAVAPIAGDFKFPNTKKELINAWMKEEKTSSADESGSGKNSDLNTSANYTKKRWLRQAISEEVDPSKPTSDDSNSSNATIESNGPLKKRKIARESESSERSCTPPTTPLPPILTNQVVAALQSPPEKIIHAEAPKLDMERQSSDMMRANLKFVQEMGRPLNPPIAPELKPINILSCIKDEPKISKLSFMEYQKRKMIQMETRGGKCMSPPRPPSIVPVTLSEATFSKLSRLRSRSSSSELMDDDIARSSERVIAQSLLLEDKLARSIQHASHYSTALKFEPTSSSQFVVSKAIPKSGQDPPPPILTPAKQASPNMVQQRENLTERLKKEFGLALGDDDVKKSDVVENCVIPGLVHNRIANTRQPPRLKPGIIPNNLPNVPPPIPNLSTPTFPPNLFPGYTPIRPPILQSVPPLFPPSFASFPPLNIPPPPGHPPPS